MPVRKLLVFISSTSDLGAERDAVARALPMSFEGYLYEKEGAQGVAPRDRLHKVLRDTDAYVGIFGERYGSVYPDCDKDRSIVEWEYDTAREEQVPEVIGFTKDGIETAELEQDQQQFFDKLTHFTEGSWVKRFNSPDDLKQQVRESLLQWLSEYYLGLQPLREEFGLRLHAWLQRMSFILCYALILVAVGFRRSCSDTTLLVFTGVIGVILVAFMVLLVSVWRPYRE